MEVDSNKNLGSESVGSETLAETVHVPVMPDEVVEWMTGHSPQVIVDGTYGGGGHSALLVKKLPPGEGVVIGLDRDPLVSERVDSEQHDPRLTVFLGSYEKIPKALEAMEITKADAILLDVGLSSDQLADANRGFSFNADGPLDLRFDPENGDPASDWLAWKKEDEIANAIYQYGEERCSRRIAREIVMRRRKENPVKTVNDLVEICRRCVPTSKNHNIHPATRTFQALRIVVNDELGIMERTIKASPDWLSPGGRLVVISFHSLEDRIVKNAFRDDERWNVLTKKPLRPTDDEIRRNPRSRSAKLRVAELR
ncbi:16S rRNA (cytosine(1402)-N(4))-methyltransferase RsmH [Rubripirellula reticaptiva]|uniref:Ribosomal RNA small subunit methyltransferase H n=1 Tax=Rubripirellula reticaptiva TaxID=2528013 RepID=A0A5C6EGK4_9BACT|nr:Ribosomal RNA small subunit methyltransferase H [Rubripirellula reticaptiva]